MSGLDRFLTFLFNHQLTIIEGLFGLILLVALAWLVLNLREENSEKSGASLSEIEESLKKVLGDLGNVEQQGLPLIKDQETTPPTTGGAPATAKAGAAATGAAAPPSGTIVQAAKPVMTTATISPSGVGTQAVAPPPPSTVVTGGGVAPATSATVLSTTPQASTSPSTAGSGGTSDAEALAKIKLELQQKAEAAAQLEKSLAELKTQLEQSKSQPALQAPQNNDELNRIKAKLSEVEEKLAEYEIIEDDIANLSLYKEENARLKNEIAKRSESPVTPDVIKVTGAQPEAPASKSVASGAAPEGPSFDEELLKMVQEDATRVKQVTGGGETEQASSELVTGGKAPADTSQTVAGTQPTAATDANAADSVLKPVNTEKLLNEFDQLVKNPTTEAEAKPKESKDGGEALIKEFESFIKGGS